MPHATPRSHLAQLGKLPALDVTTVEGLSHDEKQPIIAAVSKVCHKLMQDMGVVWKPEPVDDALRRRTVDWIQSELEPITGPVSKQFLLAADASITYTERVYEGGDFETKVSMVKYLALAIYLDDTMYKSAEMAKKAESFLMHVLEGDLASPSSGLDGLWLDQYRKMSIELARHMSDPFASNMVLHSCILYIEGCALECYIQQDQAKYFIIKDAETERAMDDVERKLAADRGFDIPLPFDNDRVGVQHSSTGGDDAGGGTHSQDDYLVPNGWPVWLRERSAVVEPFAITSFRAPGGVDVPTWLWVTAIPEMRTALLSINDLLSFAKELLANDTASSIFVLTKERRLIGMPGTAPDGGWCLRDSLDEVFGKTVVTGARINRLLRPTTTEARYGPDGKAYSIGELIGMLKGGEGRDEHRVGRDEVMKALTLKLWETHQRGYVAWHFQSPRYRARELFGWVREMVGGEDVSAEWLTSCFPGV